MLAFGGGVLGLALASGGLGVLVSIGPATLPRLDEIGINASVLAFTAGTSFLSALFFGLVPVAKDAAPRIGLAIQGGGRTASSSRDRHRARNVLIVTQIALCLVLLIASGLMIRTFVALRAVQPGFTRSEQVQLVRDSQCPVKWTSNKPCNCNVTSRSGLRRFRVHRLRRSPAVRRWRAMIATIFFWPKDTRTRRGGSHRFADSSSYHPVSSAQLARR